MKKQNSSFRRFLVLAMMGLAAVSLWIVMQPKQDGPPPRPPAPVVDKQPVKPAAEQPAKAPAPVRDHPAAKTEDKKSAEKTKPPSPRPGDDVLPIIGTATGAKVVAVTFDHSTGNTFTPRILDILRERNLRVTFFLMGPWAEEYPDTARRIAAEGHEIASHGYRHEDYGDQTDEWIREDLSRSGQQIKKVTGAQPRLFRPPNGHYSARSLQITAALGYKTILWNVDSIDWMNPGRDKIIERVMRRLKPGAIVLLHASDIPRQTADALPILLNSIAAEGYRVVTVSELLQKHAEKGILRDGQ